MNFETKLIKNAEKWLDCAEKASTPNRSVCVDEIHIYFGGEPVAEPWCAKFVWMVADKTFKEFGIENPLRRTASTRTMLAQAEKDGLPVDKTPAPGSIFFKPRGNNPAFGHMGIVVNTEGSKIITIEGNVSDQVDWGERVPNSEYRFIHIENLVPDMQIAGFSMPKFPETSIEFIDKYDDNLKWGASAILLALGSYGVKKIYE